MAVQASIALGLALTQAPIAGAAAPVAAPAAPLHYADLADLAIESPVVAIAVVTKAQRLGPDASPGLAPGRVRFYIEADVEALIRGAAGLPATISYLVDMPLDARGKPPKPKKMRVILFADRVAGRASEVRLIAPDAQIPWAAQPEATVRAILTEALSPSPPPKVTRVGNAFHVPGSLPGEGETQIFLQTADSRPVSLSILRRPDEQPRWAVALGEMVDESAGPPRRDTLLWYRLACTLPARLPSTSTASLSIEEADLARKDYGVVIAGLGRCDRARS